MYSKIILLTLILGYTYPHPVYPLLLWLNV